MKRIINGRKYDTETAQLMGEWSNAGNWRDFNHMEETLYKKKTGEFFLFGEGGPNTKYAERVDTNSWSGGSRIMPLTYDEARQWAEEHLDSDDYEAIFGDVQEDDTRVSATFRLSASMLETLKRRASAAGTGISEYLELILDEA